MYLNMAKAGENVVLRSRTGNFRLLPVVIPQLEEPKRDIYEEFRGALTDLKAYMNGDKSKFRPAEDLLNEL